MKHALAFAVATCLSTGAYAVDCDPVRPAATAPVVKAAPARKAKPASAVKRVYKPALVVKAKRVYKPRPAATISAAPKPDVQCTPVARTTILSTLLDPIQDPMPALFQPTPIDDLFALDKPELFNPLLVEPVFDTPVAKSMIPTPYVFMTYPTYPTYYAPPQYIVDQPIITPPTWPTQDVPVPGTMLLVGVAGLMLRRKDA